MGSTSNIEHATSIGKQQVAGDFQNFFPLVGSPRRKEYAFGEGVHKRGGG